MQLEVDPYLPIRNRLPKTILKTLLELLSAGTFEQDNTARSNYAHTRPKSLPIYRRLEQSGTVNSLDVPGAELDATSAGLQRRFNLLNKNVDGR